MWNRVSTKCFARENIFTRLFQSIGQKVNISISKSSYWESSLSSLNFSLRFLIEHTTISMSSLIHIFEMVANKLVYLVHCSTSNHYVIVDFCIPITKSFSLRPIRQYIFIAICSYNTVLWNYFIATIIVPASILHFILHFLLNIRFYSSRNVSI